MFIVRLTRDRGIVAPVQITLIPAAGLGTGFLPATKSLPKEMLPIVDKPLIQYAVEESCASGIHDFVVITGRGKAAIEDHFDHSFELEHNLVSRGKFEIAERIRGIARNSTIAFIRQHEALGLGHAVLQGQPMLRGQPFAVLLADDIIISETPCLAQLLRVYSEFGEPIVGLQRVPREVARDYGIAWGTAVASAWGAEILRLDGVIEKPETAESESEYAIIGRYILTPDIFGVLADLKPGRNEEIQLTDALSKLISVRPVYGVVVDGRRFDAGDKAGFLKATVALALEDGDLGHRFRSYLRQIICNL